MMDIAETVQRLKATLDQPGLPVRAAAHCQSLVDRLQAPVRVAVFGLPRAGKAAVLNALAETTVLTPGAQHAPIFVRCASSASATLTNGHGQSVASPAEMPFAPPPDAAMAELGLPLDALAEMSLLNVVADPTSEDMSSALSWAAPRCDIAIWCTRHWTAEEQAIWSNGPDTLKNHALMIAASNDENTRASQSFTQGSGLGWCDLTLEVGGEALKPSSADLLRRRVHGMINHARAEDRDVADFLIAQHAPGLAHKPVSQEHPKGPPDLNVVDGAKGSDVGNTAEPTPEACAVLSRLIIRLREAAQDALACLAQDQGEKGLERMQDAVHQVLELAGAEHGFAETWPTLYETLCEADDLMLLLALESNETKTTEAANLLAQVRQDMDFALVA